MRFGRPAAVVSEDEPRQVESSGLSTAVHVHGGGAYRRPSTRNPLPARPSVDLGACGPAGGAQPTCTPVATRMTTVPIQGVAA